MIFRIVNALMTALFALSVAVQYNDPDPVRWMAVYGAAGVLSAWAAVRGTAPLTPALVVGAIAIIWGFSIATGVDDLTTLADMFEAWEMHSQRIEEAREASGLLIVATWMGVLAAQRWRASHRTQQADK